MTSAFAASLRSPEPAVLVLEDGTRYDGPRLRRPRHAPSARSSSPPGMTGYQETLTDPSYAGQIVVQTAPHIGNTGHERRGPGVAPHLGLRLRRARPLAASSRNFRARRSLDDELVDRRRRRHQRHRHPRRDPPHLRDAGAMRGGIFSGADAARSSADEQLAIVRRGRRDGGPQPLGRGLGRPAATVTPADGRDDSATSPCSTSASSSRRSTTSPRAASTCTCCRRTSRSRSCSRSSRSRCSTRTAPATPAASDDHVALLRGVLDERLPFFGICFGNQLLGRALGFGTYKLPFGHRGINQPVLDKHDRPGRDHRAQPRLRRRRAARGRHRQPERLRPASR